MSNATDRVMRYDRDATQTRLHDAVDDVRDTLVGCADEAEQTGFYPERGWRALHDSGLFRMKAPLELGGFQADPVTQIEIFEEVSWIDSAAGWTLFVGAGTLALMSGWVQEPALDWFMVDGRLPRVCAGVVPSGTAVPAPGGFRVTGRWQFGSGSRHAERFAGNAFIEGDHEPPVLGFLITPEDVTLHDNWNVNALRGTGSQDFSVDDVFVPAERTFNGFAQAERGAPLLRIGVPGLVAMEHGAYAIGLAQRSIDEMAELAKSKSRGYVRPEGVAARGKFQFDLGRAETLLSAARHELKMVYEQAWDAVCAGEVADAPLQVRLRCAAVLATEVGADVCRTMFAYAGAKALYSGNVIERCMRDVVAGAQHGMVNNVAYEARAQLRLGDHEVLPLT